MPNKTGIDNHAARIGVTTSGATNISCTVTGNVDEAKLLELIRGVTGTGGSVSLVGGAFTVHY